MNKTMAAIGIIIGLGIFLLLDGFNPIARDSTDGHNRSGMRLHIDNKTGCHYLSTRYGGPSPRLDRKGNHICTGPE